MEPKFRGLGYCMIFIRMIVNAYSPVVMSWSIYYLGATFLSLTVSEKMSFEQSAIFFQILHKVPIFKGPFLYYVSTFLGFFRPTHCAFQLKDYSNRVALGQHIGRSYTVLKRQKNLPFSEPTQSFCWRIMGRVP